MVGYKSLYRGEQKQLQLSGHSYLPARERINSDNVIKLKISVASRCDHETTVCAGFLPKDDDSLASLLKSGISCVESWQQDWELLFERTAGGRKLLKGEDKSMRGSDG